VLDAQARRLSTRRTNTQHGDATAIIIVIVIVIEQLIIVIFEQFVISTTLEQQEEVDVHCKRMRSLQLA